MGVAAEIGVCVGDVGVVEVLEGWLRDGVVGDFLPGWFEVI